MIRRRRMGPNRMGFALQLCILRYPGRLLREGEIIPLEITQFIAKQLDLRADHLARYASRSQTRYEHSSALQEACGYRPFEGRARGEIQPWLLQAALGTSSGI